jgi:hypothetical protein
VRCRAASSGWYMTMAEFFQRLERISSVPAPVPAYPRRSTSWGSCSTAGLTSAVARRCSTRRAWTSASTGSTTRGARELDSSPATSGNAQDTVARPHPPCRGSGRGPRDGSLSCRQRSRRDRDRAGIEPLGDRVLRTPGSARVCQGRSSARCARARGRAGTGASTAPCT